MDVSVSLDLRMTWSPQPTYHRCEELARDTPLLFRPLKFCNCWLSQPSLAYPEEDSTTPRTRPSTKRQNPQLTSGMDEERWEKIKVRGDVTRKVAQELDHLGEKDCNFFYPGGYHSHHMCQWLPLEFCSAQPERSQAAALPFLALLVWEHGSPLRLQIKPDLQEVVGVGFIAQPMSTCPAEQRACSLKTSGTIHQQM